MKIIGFKSKNISIYFYHKIKLMMVKYIFLKRRNDYVKDINDLYFQYPFKVSLFPICFIL